MLLVTWRDTGSVGSFSPTVLKHANFQIAGPTRYRIVGNFRGRKVLRILRFCGYLRKFSPQILGCVFFGMTKASNLGFLGFFSPIGEVFSLESFLLYGTLVHRSYCQWNYLVVVHVVTVGQ